MEHAVTLCDETTTGDVIKTTRLRLVSKRVSLRELIALRIQQEINSYNEQSDELYYGLIQPTDTEETLNGFRMRKRRPISFEKQLELAYQAFETNGFFVIADDNQVENLDDEIVIGTSSKVSFIKLVPLVGG